MQTLFGVLRVALVAMVAVSQPVLAEAPTPPASAGAAAERRDPVRLPAEAVSTHAVGQGSARLGYSATAGALPLIGGKGETTAEIFYVAYTLEGAAPLPQRPVTFVFNGGPGAASAFLHLAAIGPRVVNFTDNGSAAKQPVELADNPDTWLDATDLVFVDPVGTGYSRSAAGTDEADRAFYGVDKDADALAEFVRRYLARSGRSLSPVLLAGESYGGFRAPLIANRLLGRGVAVRGVVLISPALEFSMVRPNPYTVVPLALVLPSLAVVHMEGRDGAQGPLESLAEVERFARTTYLVHLASGLRNDAGIDRALAQYTGLSEEIIKRRESRISARAFGREFQKRSDRVLSGYDGTVSAPVPRGSGARFDPILEGTVTVLEPAFAQYAGAELGYRTDLPYRLLNREVNGRWDYGTSSTQQGFAGALDDLQSARTLNPALGVLIMHGYTDLVTPYAVSRYLVDQLAPIEGARAIELRTYRGGHMMYLRAGSRRALAQDARDFYRRVSAAP